MKSYVIFAPKRTELSVLSSVMSFLMRKRGEHQLPFIANKVDRVVQYLDGENTVRMMVCDVTVTGILPILEQLRQHNTQMRLVLLADNSISPVNYIRPTILPTALLWRPIQEDGVKQTLWEVMGTMLTPAQTEDSGDAQFSVETRGIVKRYAYKDILFFEARDKRLYLHANRKEVPFQGALERLADELPQEFIRVHKSYIVNRTRVEQIQYGQNLILLEGGMMIPISRSYKAEVKAVFS